MRIRVGRSLACLLTVVLLVGAGCTSLQEADGDGSAASEEDTEELDLATKPDMTSVLADDRGDPPSRLQTTDVVEGDGEQARAGDEVLVHYVGAAWSSGAQFDASWDRDQPFRFVLGAGEVIAGWDQGVEGMKVGGRRILIIPPELAYGDRGAGSDIAPGETIAFVVDLLEVEG